MISYNDFLRPINIYKFNWFKVLIYFLISYFIFLGIILYFNYNQNIYYNYILTNIAGFVAISLLYILLLGSDRFIIIFLLIFLLKIFIGTWHFLTFLQPNYFSGDNTFDFIFDYKWMHESMSYIADFRKESGYFSQIPADFMTENKNSYLFIFASDLYYFGGNNVLNICVYNSMFSSFTAIIITYLGRNYYKLTNKNNLFILILSALFPISLIPSIVYRDIIGQFFIVIGGLILLSISIKKKYIFLLPFACFLFYMQRKIYFILPIIAYLLSNYTFLGFKYNNTKRTDFSKNMLLNIFLLILLISLFIFLNTIFQDFNLMDEIEGQEAAGVGRSFTDLRIYFMFPMYAILGFMGPFPWTQFFDYNWGTIYQPADYMASVFMITSIICILPFIIKHIKLHIGFDIVTITSFLLILTGLATTALHTAYLCTGFIFLLPFLTKYVKPIKFIKIFFLVIFAFIIINIIWVFFGFVGSGIGGSLKV